MIALYYDTRQKYPITLISVGLDSEILGTTARLRAEIPPPGLASGA